MAERVAEPRQAQAVFASDSRGDTVRYGFDSIAVSLTPTAALPFIETTTLISEFSIKKKVPVSNNCLACADNNLHGHHIQLQPAAQLHMTDQPEKLYYCPIMAKANRASEFDRPTQC